MGGSIPPILWYGAGDAIVLDDVGVLSLNLPDAATPQSEAKPAPADLSKGTPPAALPAITLPESMEAKVRCDAFLPRSPRRCYVRVGERRDRCPASIRRWVGAVGVRRRWWLSGCSAATIRTP